MPYQFAVEPSGPEPWTHGIRHLPGYLAAGRYRPVCTLALAALLLSFPMVLYGPFPEGHDAPQHLNYARLFSEQFWGGELAPHWLLKLNHGLGSASLFVYPPLPSYVYSLLEPLAQKLHFSAFNTMAFLALFGSGICAFLWISTMASRAVALLTAMLYMLMPYHLAIDFYRRTALSECWALTWIPLFLYFMTQVRREKRAFAALAAAYALLIFSHLISIVIFSMIPLLVAVTLSGPGRRLRSTLTTSAAMLLGTGLSCVYLLPTLYHTRYFAVSRIIVLETNLLHLGRGLFQFQAGAFDRTLRLSVIDTLAFIVFCAVVSFKRALPEQKKQIAVWLAVCTISIFMMSRVSAPVWEKLPFLLFAVEYPWRLNILLCIAALPIAAAFLSQIPWPLTWSRALSLVFLLLFVVTWFISYASVLKDYKSPRSFREDAINESDGFLPAWTIPGMDVTSARQASTESPVRFLSGNGTANVLLWKPRHLKFETSTTTGGWVMINQFYYPEWRAQVDGDARPLPIKPALRQGLLEVQVPPGTQKIRLDIPVGFAERLGRWVSALCVLLCIGWIGLEFEPPKPASLQFNLSN
jgi:hypothetical protein